MIKKPSHRTALLLMIIAPLMWSSAGVLTRQLEQMKDFQASFLRGLFAAFFVGIILFAQHRSRTLSVIKQLGKVGVFSGLVWGVMFSFFMLALTMTTVANTLIIQTLAPLLTAILAWLVLKERVPLNTWLAILIAFSGMLYMLLDNFSSLDARGMIGVMLALCIPIASAINVITLKKVGAKIDLMPTVMLGGLFSALLMAPFALPDLFLNWNWHDIGVLVILGGFQLAIPCLMMVYAAQALTAPEVSLLSLLEDILGPLWVWIFVHEVPSQATLIGGAIVIGALILNEIHFQRKM